MIPRRTLVFILPWLAALLLAVVSVGAAEGLRISADGGLLLKEQPFRGYGVNYFDAFNRTLGANPKAGYDEGFAGLAKRKIPFARLAACGYWPNEQRLYLTNQAEFFRRLDGVVKSAEQHGVGLIPSLFWFHATVPDMVGEPVGEWGNPASRTHAFMRSYVSNVVTRYRGSFAIWAWELGNEFNLPADLPNAAEHRPPVVPSLGTPATRSQVDDLTHAAFRTALVEFGREVRRHDPHRLILSGNAFPRVSAWHQMTEKSWQKDSSEQFATMLAGDNPDPINCLTVRGYEDSDFTRLSAAMDLATRLKKPLFVGEFGVSGPGDDTTKAAFARRLESLEKAGVTFAALWVYDFVGQQADWSVTPSNSRSYQLAALQEVNARLNPSKPDISVVRLPAGALQPQALTDASGDVHVFHLTGDPKASDVVYRQLKAGSTNWSVALRVNQRPGGAIAMGTVRGVQAALGRDGRLHVVWNGTTDASGHEGSPLFYTRSSTDGRSFEPERDIIVSTDHLDGGGSVAADGAGNVHVVWHGSPTGQAGEPTRRIFVRKSSDDGKSFANEAPLVGADPGVCGCCGLKASIGADGGLAVVYRAAVGGMDRGINLLAGGAPDASLKTILTDPWRTGSCPMSTAAITVERGQSWAAWEAQGKVRFAQFNATNPVIHDVTVAGRSPQKHPSLAVNRDGRVLVVWMEGTGWNRGGDVAWQEFDAAGKPLSAAERRTGLPAWTFATATVRADGGFVVIY